jgi:hypothetical protein
MRLRSFNRLIWMIPVMLWPPVVNAECPIVGWQDADVVFHGTVLDVTNAPRITFDVDRVWKGDASRRFDVLHPFQGTGIEVSEGFGRFKNGASYFVVARKRKVRTAAGVESIALFADICATQLATIDESVRITRNNGREPRP